MEVLKINFVGYYDYDPITKLKQYYCDENDSEQEISEDTKCQVCKENILNYSINISSNINKLFYKEGIVLGVCGHIFHKNCMYEWLKKNECCPIDKVYWQYDRDLDTVSNLFFKNDNDCKMKSFNAEEYDLDILKRKRINTLTNNKIIENHKCGEIITPYSQEEEEDLAYDDFLDKYGTKKYKANMNETLGFRNDMNLDEFLNTSKKDVKYQTHFDGENNNIIITSNENNKNEIIRDNNDSEEEEEEENAELEYNDEEIELLPFEETIIMSDDEDI